MVNDYSYFENVFICHQFVSKIKMTMTDIQMLKISKETEKKNARKWICFVIKWVNI